MAVLIPEEAFVFKILGDAEIAGLIGNRLYGNAAPQKVASPYGIYSRLVSTYDYHMTASSDLMECRIQLDWYADTYPAVKYLAERARMAVAGFKGTVTIDGNTLNVQKFHLTQDVDVFIQPPQGSEDGIHSVSQQYSLAVGLESPDLV